MKTLIYESLDHGRVRCGMCHHFCVIPDGNRGICQVRENREGTLIALTYPKVISRGVDPIEKKPLFHVKPGSTSFSIAAVGCNFKCLFCQNSTISQLPNAPNTPSVPSSRAERNGNRSQRDGNRSAPSAAIPGVTMDPATLVAQALRAGCHSISYTYTEPTVYFELALECATLAKQKGLLNIFVTNGFMSKAVLQAAAGVLDAANVDLKAFSDGFYRTWCNGRLEPIKENLILMKSLGIFVEVTTLLIPGLNDAPDELEALAHFLADRLGPETPWHISRFHPTYQMVDRPATPIDTLKRAHDIGKAAGLYHVYTGNAPGLASENTFCHACGRLLIERYAYNTKSDVTPEGHCPDCKTPLYGIFQ